MILVLLFFLTIILNLLCLIIKVKSRLILILSLFVCYILFVGNLTDPDMINYTLYYSNATNLSNVLLHPTEIGYYLLNVLCNYLNLDIVGFKTVIFLLCLVLLINNLRFWKTNLHAFIFFYMLSFLLINIIQFRFFIATNFIMYGFRFIFDDNSEKGYLKYIICIIIATSFHTLSILFLVYLLYKIKNKKIFRNILIFISCITLFLLQLLPNDLIINMATVMGISDSRLELYFSNISFGIGSIIIILSLITISMLSVRFLKDYRIKNYCMYIGGTLLCYIPLYSLSIHFYRLPQVILLFCNIINCSEFSKLTFKHVRFYKILFVIIICILSINFFNYYIIGYDYYINDIINPIFFDNYFLGGG